jgi:hypothetical protein
MKTGRSKVSPKERFERIGWDDVDGCYVWKGYKGKDGYGTFRLDQKTCTTAHRAAYLFFKGSPDGKVVRHKCDNPPCVNPDHLELGSPLDNVMDAVERGRRSPQNGENNHASKLTQTQADEIRSRYASEKVSQQALAAEYGVSQVTISLIVRNKIWP